jgi:hypothetical protein
MRALAWSAIICVWGTSRTSAQPPETPAGEHDATTLAKQTQNPVADLVSIPFQFNFNSGGAFGDRSNILLNVQPVIPINVTPEWNVIARPIVPFVTVPQPRGDSDGGLGDINLELFATPANAGSIVWGVGPIFSFPTATLDEVATGSWGIGPAGLVLYQAGPWVVGALATQTWTISDFGDERDLDAFLLQPFANYNFGKGWAIGSAPIITASWDAPSNGWTVPLGGGLIWTTEIGGQAMNLGAHYYYNVERPDEGAKNQLRLIVSFLFPKTPPAAPSRAVASSMP